MGVGSRLRGGLQGTQIRAELAPPVSDYVAVTDGPSKLGQSPTGRASSALTGVADGHRPHASLLVRPDRSTYRSYQSRWRPARCTTATRRACGPARRAR